MARMTASVVVFVGLLASVSARCGDVQSGDFYPNKFLGAPPAYVNGQADTSTTAGESVTIMSTIVTFDLFGDTSNNFRAFDTGIVLAGPATLPTTAPDLSSFSVGATTDTLAFSPYALTVGDFSVADSAKVEAKLIERANEYSNGNPVGPHICELEQAEWEVHAWSGVIQEVDGIIIVTWEFVIGTNPVLSQLAFIHTTLGQTYVTMQYALLDGVAIGSPTYFIANGDYATVGDARYATVCGDPTLLGMSNHLCGVPNTVLFSLAIADACTPTTTPTCGSLDSDYNTNNPNCRALTETQDTCYVEGSCEYTYGGTADSFKFDFLIMEEVAEYNGWEIVDNTGKTRLQQWCTLATAVRNTDNDVEIVQDFEPSLLSDCGSAMQPDGTYVITLHNYDTDEAVTAPTAANGNQIYKKGSRFFEFKCRPSDFVTQKSLAFTRPDGVAKTTVPTVTGRDCTFSFTNALNPSTTGFSVYSSGSTVALATPLYLQMCFDLGTPYYENASPYGIYAIDCMVGNTVDFAGKTRRILTNGCKPNNDGRAFELASEFVSYNSAGVDTTFCINAGVMRAARWIDTENIWVRCTFDFCRNTDFSASSKCKSSCTGTGVDQAPSGRKKRQTGHDESQQVTAHIRVDDKRVYESEKSCANKMLAYTGIAVLVVLNLVATMLATFLFMRLRARSSSRKA